MERIWNYFANGHRKGEIDGANALLEHEIHKEQFGPQAQNLANAHDIVTFCQQRIGIMALDTDLFFSRVVSSTYKET